MSNNVESLTSILTIVIIVIFVLLAILAIVYFTSNKKKNQRESNTNKTEESNDKEKGKKIKNFTIDSVMNFMEFDKIEDNMIVTKNATKYIMIVECQGINYDLMSEVEKNAVEEGFIQFLNSIRHPIQIYVQSRTVNLENSIATYRDRVKEIEENYQKQEMQYKEMRSSGKYTKEQIDRAYYELTKQRNLTEYGKDIIYNTERMSLNKNVLNQRYYIVVPYYPEELGQNNFDKEEIKNMAFSELYTRCQSIIRTLSACEVNGKILTSEKLMDLLYVAYNRDEQETFGLDKALRAGYDELYSTAQDVLDKKMKTLDNQIEQEAINKANEKVMEAQSAKERALSRKQRNMDDLIDDLAKLIIERNASSIGYDVAQDAINGIDEDKNRKKGGTEDNVKEQTKRRKTTKTA